MDEIPRICDQENNQLLLNAIRNKFAAQDTSEAASYSPPKFNIPILRTADATERQQSSFKFFESIESSQVSSTPFAKSTQTKSSLNEFILGQLQEKTKVPDKGFVLPTLSIGNTDISKVLIPTSSNKESYRNAEKYESNLSTLSDGLHHLSFNEKATAPTTTIDLTAALSNNLILPHLKSTTVSNVGTKAKIALQDFDIPFIECDLKEQTVLLPIAHEYCQPDISHLKLEHCLVAPSSFARITCLKFKRLRSLPRIDHSFKAKHKIQCFRFDTKSPDDIILSKFQKYQR